MAEEEKEESYLDAVKAAVESQKAPETAEPKAEEEKIEEKTEEPPHVEGPAEGAAETEETKAEGDKPPEDKPEKPQKVVQDESPKSDIARPPRRLPIRTKQKWLSIPEDVREDIWEREQAFDKAHARYDGLGQFAIKAESAGTTLQKAMQQYNAMETAMRDDPIRGSMQVWQALGYDPNEVIRSIVRMVTPSGDQSQGQAQNPPPPTGLSREELQAELDKREISSQIKTFESDPAHHYLEPYIEGEPLGPIRRTMQAVLNGGIANTLQDAYDMALKVNGLDPAAHAADKGQAEKAAAVNRSRQAAKATIGAPSSGQKVEGRASDSSDLNWIDTVKAAYNKARGE